MVQFKPDDACMQGDSAKSFLPVVGKGGLVDWGSPFGSPLYFSKTPLKCVVEPRDGLCRPRSPYTVRIGVRARVGCCVGVVWADVQD